MQQPEQGCVLGVMLCALAAFPLCPEACRFGRGGCYSKHLWVRRAAAPDWFKWILQHVVWKACSSRAHQLVAVYGCFSWCFRAGGVCEAGEIPCTELAAQTVVGVYHSSQEPCFEACQQKSSLNVICFRV